MKKSILNHFDSIILFLVLFMILSMVVTIELTYEEQPAVVQGYDSTGELMYLSPVSDVQESSVLSEIYEILREGGSVTLRGIHDEIDSN